MITITHSAQLVVLIACLGKKVMTVLPDVIQAIREQEQQEAVRNAFNDPNPPQSSE